MTDCKRCAELTKELAKLRKKVQIDSKRNTRHIDDAKPCKCGALGGYIKNTSSSTGLVCLDCGGEV